MSEIDVALTESQYDLVLGIYRENYREGVVFEPKVVQPGSGKYSPLPIFFMITPLLLTVLRFSEDPRPAPEAAAADNKSPSVQDILNKLFVTLQVSIALERVSLTLEHDHPIQS